MAGFLIVVAVWHVLQGRGGFVLCQVPAADSLLILLTLQLGGLAATCTIFEIAAFGGATVIAAKLSAESLAAHQIALNIASVTYMVPLGISAAAAVAVGRYIWRWKPRTCPSDRVSGHHAPPLAAYGLFCAISPIVFPHRIVWIYSPDPKVLAIGAPLLALAAAFQNLRLYPDSDDRMPVAVLPAPSADDPEFHWLLDHRPAAGVLAMLQCEPRSLWRLDRPDHRAGLLSQPWYCWNGEGNPGSQVILRNRVGVLDCGRGRTRLLWRLRQSYR